jgi:hypothetical protein
MAFQAANGTQLGRHLVKNVGRKWRGGGCDGLPSLEISLESVESHAVPHSILPNHTEGHRLNGRDALSRKAGLRLGKDSTGVEASPNQDKLRRMNKYCRLQGLNRCPLAWELGTLPLDHLGFYLNPNFLDYKESWFKNPPPGCNLGQPQYGRLPKKNDNLAVQYEDCPWLN